MNYKMIVTDIDDTLLDEHHQVSEKNQKAIAWLLANGYEFVLASGRPTAGMQKMVQLLGLDQQDCHIISYNGCEISETRSGKTIFATGLALSEFAAAVAFAQSQKLTICSYTKTAVVVNQASDESRYEADILGMEYVVSDDIVTYFKDRTIPKAIIFGSAEAITQAQVSCRKRLGEYFEIVVSKPIFLELTPKGIHKGAAVLKLAELCNISVDEIIAVGDGENDVTMLQTAGLGVAVSNACDLLKLQADEICVSHNESVIDYLVRMYFAASVESLERK